MTEQRQIVVARTAGVSLTQDIFALRSGPIEPPSDGQVLVRVKILSIDPYLRTLIGSRPVVGTSSALGSIMRGRGVGEVIESRSPQLPTGALVIGDLGWQEVATLDAHALRLLPKLPYPISWQLGVLGVPGVTALLAFDLIGRPQRSETVFISSAAGGVGSAAGQIAKSRGCHTIGATSAGKFKVCRESFGYQLCVDRDSPDGLAAELAKVSDGIDVVFDNVGDVTLNAVAPLMRPRGRIILCGRLASYDQAVPSQSVDACWELMLMRRLRVEGFNVRDHLDQLEVSVLQLASLADRGVLAQVETVIRGLENAPATLLGLLNGKYTGKVLVELS